MMTRLSRTSLKILAQNSLTRIKVGLQYVCNISSSHLFSANETYPRCSGVFSTVLVVRSQYYPLPNQLCDTDTQMVLYECQTAESIKVMCTS